MLTPPKPPGAGPAGGPAAPDRHSLSLAEMLADSAQFRRLTLALVAATLVFGVLAVSVLAPGSRPLEVAVLWGLFSLSLMAFGRVPAPHRRAALVFNGLMLQAAALGTAWLQGWGLNGGSLYFMAPSAVILAALLPARTGALVWLSAVLGTLALGYAHAGLGGESGAAPRAAPMTGLALQPPVMLKLALLISGQTLAHALGRALGRLFHQQLVRETQAVARYRDFFDQVPIAVIVHRRGVILDANTTAAQLLAFPDRQSMHGVELTAAAAGANDAALLVARVGRIEKLPVGSQLEPTTVRLRTLQGRLLDCQTVCSRVSLPDGPANIAMLTDETLRLAMEASLRWSLSLQQQLVASGPLAVWVRHLSSGRTINTNEAAAQLSGYTVAELVGGVVQDRPVPWTEPDTWAAVEDRLLRDGGHVSRTLSLTTRNGEHRTVRAWASGFEVDGDQYSVWFGQDITREVAEREEREAVMEQARAEAVAASRAKSAFLANTSHELRTPLNAVIGLSRLALTPTLSDADRLRHLRQIHDSSLALSQIVSEVLDLSKIEAGRLEIERTPFDLNDLALRLADTTRTLAEAKGLRLETQLSWNGAHWVEGDPVRVRQILQNLLGNALKFTERGFIRLSLKRLSATHLCLEVLDTGPGVPIEAQELIFQPFAQADSSTTRRHGGTGLGLSIVSELSRLMGGMCEVSSTPGQGSRFWCVIELPRVDAAVIPPAAPAEGSAGPLPTSDSALRALRILVVEDNPINRMIITLMLEQQGAVVVTAQDGRQALDTLGDGATRGTLPDAVILDMQMPEMDGKETAQAVRADARLAHLPLLALTAGITPEEREEALASGVDDYLTKPIDLDELTRRLLQRVRQRRTASDSA